MSDVENISILGPIDDSGIQRLIYLYMSSTIFSLNDLHPLMVNLPFGARC